MNKDRDSLRSRTLKTGKIVLSDKAPSIECTVRNISATGACVQVSATFGIPATFDLIFDAARHRCRIAWMRETRIGVVFI
jgi:hypothetical protein